MTTRSASDHYTDPLAMRVLRQQKRIAELEAALRHAIWEPYLPAPHQLVCRDCRAFESSPHDPNCELGPLAALAAPTRTEGE
jgi:hypothetical protein